MQHFSNLKNSNTKCIDKKNSFKSISMHVIAYIYQLTLLLQFMPFCVIIFRIILTISEIKLK